jgi:Fe-S-cluster containining protein
MHQGLRRVFRFPRAAPDRRSESVEQLDRRLLGVLDDGWRRAAECAGSWLECGPGCSDCCHGPFPVTGLDVRRLRGGLHELRGRSPQRAAAVECRAREAVATLKDGFAGDFATGRLVHDQAVLDRCFERHRSLPCPALDSGSGRCELYAARPVACRTYGPPVRFGDVLVAPCRLCFRGADARTVARCRFEPDPEGLEQAILARLGVAPGEDWETLIAFALAGYL